MPQTIVETAIACLEAEEESGLGVNRIAWQLKLQLPAIYKHLEAIQDFGRAVDCKAGDASWQPTALEQLILLMLVNYSDKHSQNQNRCMA